MSNKVKFWYFIYMFLDMLIVVVSFLLAILLKSGGWDRLFDYVKPIYGVAVVWVLTGMVLKKFSIKTKPNLKAVWYSMLKSDLLSVIILIASVLLFDKFHYSKFIASITVGMTVVIESIVLSLLYYSFKFHKQNPSFSKNTPLITKSKKLEDTPSSFERRFSRSDLIPAIHVETTKKYSLSGKKCPGETVVKPLKDLLAKNYLLNCKRLYKFLDQYVELENFSSNCSMVINSSNIYNIEHVKPGSQHFFLNLTKGNDFRRINKFLIQINKNLTMGGIFCGCIETKTQRRRRFVRNYGAVFGSYFYAHDFVFNRVFPKISILKGLYFALTKGSNRAISETEALGRLYFCGFEMVAKKKIDNMNYFIVKKIKEPKHDQNPSYGPLIRLKRKGKNGKLIFVNKFRTMHPYSEYLQDYVYKACSLQEGGKFKKDFRVTVWGRILRKFWIDELPQFINFFKGDLNLVGVRALSEHYFSLYPEEVRELRVKVKPGLLPPFYADMPKTFDEIVASEKKYLLQKIKRPIWTDFKYFWLIFVQIVIKKARSH